MPATPSMEQVGPGARPSPGAAGWESRDGWELSGARRKSGPAAAEDGRAPTIFRWSNANQWRYQGQHTLSTQGRRRLLSIRGEPLLLGDWRRVLMIHLEVDPRSVQRGVPFPLDLHEGRAFVTLVAFTLQNLRPRRGGRIAAWLFRPIAHHEFLNVRTYVKVNGEPGIHFLAEWVANRWAAPLGPPLFSLPYRFGFIDYDHAWSSGRLCGSVRPRRGESAFRYTGTISPGAGFAPCGSGTLSEWLMERYTAYNCAGGWRRFFRVWHKPWPQCCVEVCVEDDSLLRGHWPWMGEGRWLGGNFSPGMTGVWMGRPHAVRESV